ncbi:hypothetical protein ANN_12733 [Periplaneta americana]|uniref:Uncharacterized protein n=1 Tax=Periplaneta americana TaxID=6978 RepID=A0ABQ8TJB1_PERAM|nr:hypothetical protein ANN_12733 [Periplaneta americana]
MAGLFEGGNEPPGSLKVITDELRGLEQKAVKRGDWNPTYLRHFLFSPIILSTLSRFWFFKSHYRRPPEAADSLDRPPWNVVQRCWMASAMSTRGGPTRGRGFISERQGALGEFAEAGLVYVFCRLY